MKLQLNLKIALDRDNRVTVGQLRKIADGMEAFPSLFKPGNDVELHHPVTGSEIGLLQILKEE